MELPRRFKPGDELRAELVAAIVEELWRWRRMDAAPPLAVDDAEGGGPPCLYWEGDAAAVLLAQTGGGGVAARSGDTPGSATVTKVRFGGSTLSAQTATVTAYNLSQTAVGANKYVILLSVLGYWFVVWEDCG